MMKKFEEEFPSFNHDIKLSVVLKADVEQHCLDKERVRKVLQEELGVSLNAYKKRIFERLGLKSKDWRRPQ